MSFVGDRFGNYPHRISRSSQVLIERNELPPSPQVASIPFYPGLITGEEAAALDDPVVTGPAVWWSEPGVLHLRWTQSDDVYIELLIQDLPPDAADQSGWRWRAQVREYYDKDAPLVAEFQTASTFIPRDVQDPLSVDQVQVTLFLPRAENTRVGDFAWDLQAYWPFSAEQTALFPEAVEDQNRTWVRGLVHIDRQSTYYLDEDTDSGNGGSGGVVLVEFFAGPNGRVP